MAKRKAADGLCDVCGREVVWKEADGGSLSYTCQHCDFRGYAPSQTEAKRLIEAMIKRAPGAVDPASNPAPVPSPAPVPAPVPARAKMSFVP